MAITCTGVRLVGALPKISDATAVKDGQKNNDIIIYSII